MINTVKVLKHVVIFTSLLVAMHAISYPAAAEQLQRLEPPETKASCEKSGGNWDKSPGGFPGQCLRGNEKQSCTSLGGEWKRVCMSGFLKCVMPTKDAGKICSDTGECENGCIYGDSPPDANGNVTGFCGYTNNPCGCRAFVNNGRVSERMCVD